MRNYIIIKFEKLMQNNQAIEIRNLLMQMQTEEVTQAQNKLATFAKDQNFYQIILTILTSSSEQQWLKTVAASYLSSTLLDEVQSQELQKSSQILKQVLYNPIIKQLDKRCFEKSIIKLLERGGKEIHNQWEQVIKDFLKIKQHFDSAYLVMACFAVADQVPHVVLRGIIQFCFEPILSSLQVSIQNANLLNEMVKMWIVAFDSLRRDEENYQVLHFMSNSQRLLDLIDTLYEFQSVDNVIVCLNPNYFELNLLKYEAAQLNKRLLLFSVDTQTKCSILQQYLKKNFAKFARTIHIMSLQQAFIETLGCEDLLTTLISLQQLFIVLSPQHLTFQGAISVLQNEVFPFLPINDEQRQKFEQSPQEFNSLAQDCCDHQTYGILKTQAVKLLETIGDKIEGCLQYALTRAIQSIKVNLGFVSNYTGQYPALQIQTAFLVASVFSYGIGNYEAELSSIKVILCDNRIKQLPPLQMSRVFTFLAYNYQQVYKNPSEGQSWIGYALQYNAHPTTAYCAFDFLSNNVDDYFNEVFLQALINQISTNQISLIWDITTKIIQNHFTKFSIQGCTIFISKLFDRINREIAQIQSKQKNNTLDLNNCISQFTSILKTLKKPQMQADTNKSQQILLSIWPIIDLYRPALQWNLEDQVLTVIISIIDVIPSIVPELHPLVPQFVDLFKANGYYQKIYLRFFNQFALKCNLPNDEVPLVKIIIALKNALLNSVQKVAIGINGKYQGSQAQRITAGNILLILQNIIAIHGTNLVESNYIDFFNQVGSLCLRLLPNIDQQSERTSTGRIIMSRTLNTLFLCHMHINTNCFYDYLARLKTQDLYHGHDTRVFTLCVAKEIFRLTDFTAVSFLIEGLLNIVGRSENKDELLHTKKKGKGKAKLHNQIRKIGDMDKILKSIDSPFIGTTTLGEQIVNLFGSMSSANGQLVRNIIASLTPESLQFLKKYVDLDSLGKKRRVIVKVVGIKTREGVSNQIDIEQQTHPKKENKIIEEDQESLDDDGPKRKRNKVKMQGKKKTMARKIQPKQ